jgi:hypothetical protein
MLVVCSMWFGEYTCYWVVMSMSSRTDPLYSNSKTESKIEFELAPHEFVLSYALSQFDSATVEPTTTAPYNGGCEWSSVWIRGTDRIETGGLLIDDPDVVGCALVLNRNDEWLYQIKWSEQARERINGLLTDEATLQAAAASDGRWTFGVSVPEPEGLMRLYEQYEEYGFDICITQIRNLNEATH